MNMTSGIVVGTATALLLAGCMQVQQPAPICNMAAIAQQRQLVAVPAASPEMAAPLIEMPLNSVSITDTAVINKIYIRSVNARRTPTGTVEVWSQVVNCTDFPLMVEGRTQFFDNTQYPAEPVSAWRRLALDPRTTNTYRETSVGGGAKASFYMVEMREGR